MIEPKIHSTIEIVEERQTVATQIAKIDLELGSTIRQVAEANGYDSIETINILERHGLPTALEFVQPMLEIMKRSPDSPLRSLSCFEMATLYVDNARRQVVVLDELEGWLKEGRTVVYQTGMWKALWASYRGKVQAAKHREGVRMNRTRDDYQKEVVELRDKVSLYEHALEKVAGEVGLDVNEFVAQLIGH